MKKRIEKVGWHVLVIFALLSIALFVIEVNTQKSVKAQYYEEKIKAGQIFQEAMKKTRQERQRIGLPIDEINDPNGTGIIGEQYTPITFQRNDVSANLTSTNPNFSAIFIEYFKKLKVKSGDMVAVGVDGTFPAVNLSLYSVLREMGIKPIIITTVSSAMWGANEPTFTWLDIEHFNYREGIFPFKSIAATYGGEDDLGRGFSPEARVLLDNAMKRNDIPVIGSDSLSMIIKQRIDLYFSQGKIKAFVNIGKSVANIGENHTIPITGLIRERPKNINENSVIGQMLDKKIPVINIIDVNKIATRYGLPIAPMPIPSLGKGKLFIEQHLSQIFALIFALIIIFVLFLVIKYDFEYYLLKKKPQEIK
jgi:poly-gamma-glutamate system protein